MIFLTLNGAFQQFSLAYTERVLAQLKRSHDGNIIPRIVFTKGGGLWLPEMKHLDCEVLGLDWTMNLGTARQLVGGVAGGPGKALQGNIDPNILFAPPEHIATEVHRVLDSFGKPHTDTSTTGPACTNNSHSKSASTRSSKLPHHSVAAVLRWEIAADAEAIFDRMGGGGNACVCK